MRVCKQTHVSIYGWTNQNHGCVWCQAVTSKLHVLFKEFPQMEILCEQSLFTRA